MSRKLKLSRETLRDLEPADERAALVRGGQQKKDDPSDAWGGEWSFCYCPVAPIMALARTYYSDGCRGRVKVELDLDVAELRDLAESLPGWAAVGERGATLEMDVEELQKIGRDMPDLGTKLRGRIDPTKIPKWGDREGPGEIR
ncbi:MAG TPA: hypothetical protein VHF89_14980 [Solirubrobacteraceae bacterium]|nr:hypothetical protein [Solirubrobacteraceae bacterium]